MDIILQAGFALARKSSQWQSVSLVVEKVEEPINWGKEVKTGKSQTRFIEVCEDDLDVTVDRVEVTYKTTKIATKWAVKIFESKVMTWLLHC